jgi:hypothetical protein
LRAGAALALAAPLLEASIMVCRDCGEELLKEDFRQLRKQKNGVCKACEFRNKAVMFERRGDLRQAEKFWQKQEREVRLQTKRADAYFALARESRLKVLPDD